MSSIAILILDALRFDHVSFYGKMKNSTPNIDKLAKNSLVYENARTPSPDSGTTMPKFFTGKKDEKIVFGPQRKGVLKVFLEIADKFPSRVRKKMYFLKKFIKKGELKEGSLIKKVEGKKACMTSSPYYSFGPEKDFDVVEKIYLSDEEWLDPKAVVKRSIDFLDKNKKDFFMLCHFMQPHSPYIAPNKTQISEKEMLKLILKTRKGEKLSEEEIKKIKKAYLENVKYVDREIGPLIDKLKELNSEIIVVADHGELLGEYGQVSHPAIKCEEINHIPLIWFKPNEKSRIIKDKFYIYDILPKIIEEQNGKK